MSLRFEGVNAEETLRRVLQWGKEEKGLVRIISAGDPESAVTAGLIARLFKSSEIEFEILNYLPGISGIKVTDSKVIGVNIPTNECQECIIFQSAGSTSAVRIKFNYLIRLACLPAGILDLVSEFDIVPAEVKGMLVASMLALHTPRLLGRELSSAEKEFIKQLSNEGVLSVVKAPPIINWLNLPKEEAVRLSIDALLPNMFMSGVDAVDEESISKELGLTPDKLLNDNYYLKTGGVNLDLYLLSYVSYWLSDMVGSEGLASAVITPKFWDWGMYGLTRTYKSLKGILDAVSSQGLEKKGGYFIVKANPREISLSVLAKVFTGLHLIDEGSILIGEWGRNYYVPIALMSKDHVKKFNEFSICGGYLCLTEL